MVISDAWRQRFGGTARLYGEKALQLFADAHICVVGIGGVGSWAAEALARTGIGAIKGQHFDIYQGIGPEAGHRAGWYNHYGRVWVLKTAPGAGNVFSG